MNAPNESVTEIDLHAYVDDQIDPARRVEVEQYLADHPEIAARVMADLRARDGLRLLIGRPSSPSSRTMRAARRLRRTLVRRRIIRSAPRVAAVLLVGVLGWLASDEWDELAIGRSEAHPVFVEEAVMSHKTALVRAQLQSQPEVPHLDAEEILAETRIALPQLPANWRVLDVQLFPSDDGLSLQVTVDKGDGRPMSLFAVRARTSAPVKPAVVRTDDEAVAYWQEGDFAYALTGRGPAAEIDRAAEDLADNLPG